MTNEAKQIAEGLAPVERKSLGAFSEEWAAGPNLSGFVLNSIRALMAGGLVERTFMDQDPPKHGQRGGELFVKLSACWFFRLTPLGLAVRAILKGEQS